MNKDPLIVLKELEWLDHLCPSCRAFEREGHRQTCKVAQVLGFEMICNSCGYPNGEEAGEKCERQFVHLASAPEVIINLAAYLFEREELQAQEGRSGRAYKARKRSDMDIHDWRDYLPEALGIVEQLDSHLRLSKPYPTLSELETRLKNKPALVVLKGGES